jgi:hypothetical protein
VGEFSTTGVCQVEDLYQYWDYNLFRHNLGVSKRKKSPSAMPISPSIGASGALVQNL